MPDLIPIITRAREMARSGDFPSVNAVRQRLKREGYADVGSELRSPAINRELIDLLRAADR